MTGNPAESGAVGRLLGFVAQLRNPRLVLAGGLPRSGTTYLENLAGRAPSVLTLDEFAPLKAPEFASFLAKLAWLDSFERAIWTDEAGASWRGYDAAEAAERAFATTLAAIVLSTASDRIAGKDPARITTAWCKTPDCESHVPALAEALGAQRLRYVHVVRDAAACARSNWRAPWQTGRDPSSFVDGFKKMLDRSRVAVERIRQTGVAVHVVRADVLWDAARAGGEARRFFAFLEETPDGELDQPGSAVDPWPAERARSDKSTLPEEAVAAILGSAEHRLWAEAFGVGTGSEIPAAPAAARLARSAASAAPSEACKICGAASFALTYADLNKSCRADYNARTGMAGEPVTYRQCGRCGFVFTTHMDGWTAQDFAERIYNAAYEQVDPDYLGPRPRALAAMVAERLEASGAPRDLRILDYGSGAGLFVDALRARGWSRVEGYDPFSSPARFEGAFDLVTCFETVEHAPDPHALFDDLAAALAPQGEILLSTLLLPPGLGPHYSGHWYIAPRNGHVSVYSLPAFMVMAKARGLDVASDFAGLISLASPGALRIGAGLCSGTDVFLARSPGSRLLFLPTGNIYWREGPLNDPFFWHGPDPVGEYGLLAEEPTLQALEVPVLARPGLEDATLRPFADGREAGAPLRLQPGLWQTARIELPRGRDPLLLIRLAIEVDAEALGEIGGRRLVFATRRAEALV